MVALPDVNVLLALAWSHHPHHQAAHEWFRDSASEGWATAATALLTESGFLRLSLNPTVVGVSIGCDVAIALLQGLVAHPDHRYIEACPSLTSSFDELAKRIRGYRQVTDAVLLQVARHHGMKLVSFDHSITTMSPWPEHVHALTP